jgi:hypothetical protein
MTMGLLWHITTERKLDIDGANPATVARHPDEFYPAAFSLNGYLVSAGIP